MKTVFDYENTRLEQKYPDFRRLVQGYKEQLMLNKITEKKSVNGLQRMRPD